MATPVRGPELDGEVRNDNFIKNDSGCCVFVPTPESPAKLVPLACEEPCEVQPTNRCGLTHPEGSGTLAGCKSTVLPHFGVVMNKRAETCHRFGYYTSGNTEEYENECGAIDKLSHTATQKPCTKQIDYTVESCDCFDERTADADTDATQDAAIALNTAKVSA